jgi:TonB family protein
MNLRAKLGTVGVAAAALAISCASASGDYFQSSRRLPYGAWQNDKPTSCVGRPADDSVVYDTTQVTEKPVVFSGPEPRYPFDARARGIQGRVLVCVVVKENGAIDQRSVTVVQSVYPSLDSAAVGWVRSAAFWPGWLGTRAVRVRVLVPIVYYFSRE